MHVSVSEAKASLSKYLKLLEKGESVIITSHHRPVAELVSRTPIFATKKFRSVLKGLLKEDLDVRFSWDGKIPQGGKLKPKIEGKSAAERLLEDRG